MDLRRPFPHRLVLLHKKLEEEAGRSDRGTIESMLNEAQAQNGDEMAVQATIQSLYRHNPVMFYKFLVNNKLSHLVLWTEAKLIVKHYRLQGIVYVKWNFAGNSYEVLPHKNHSPTDEEHTLVDQIASSVPIIDENSWARRVGRSGKTPEVKLEVKLEVDN